MKLWKTIALAVATVLAMAGSAAAEKGRGKPRQVPDTGVEEVRPVSLPEIAGAARLEEITSRSTDGLVEIEHEDGSASVYLQGRFQSVLLAGQAADGTSIASCHSGREAVKQARKPGKAKRGKRATPVAPLTVAREYK
jgi:hypothetical protein